MEQMGYNKSINRDRNRAIAAAYQAGSPVLLLAGNHSLTPSTIRAILRQEAHKRDVSSDPFYRALRPRPFLRA